MAQDPNKQGIERFIDDFNKTFNDDFDKKVRCIFNLYIAGNKNFNPDNKSDIDQAWIDSCIITDDIFYNSEIKSQLESMINNFDLDLKSIEDVYFVYFMLPYREKSSTPRNLDALYKFEKAIGRFKGHKAKDHQINLYSIITEYFSFVKDSDISDELKDEVVNKFINGMIKLMPRVLKLDSTILSDFMAYSASYVMNFGISINEAGEKLLSIYRRTINNAEHLSSKQRRNYLMRLRYAVKKDILDRQNYFSELSSKVNILQ